MDRILSIEDAVILLVKEFLENLTQKEPFNMELTNYKLALKSKLSQIFMQFGGDYETGSKSLSSAVEGIKRVIEEEVNKLELEDEERLERFIRALEATNEVLKEFLYDNMVRDKETLSMVSGNIGSIIERLSYEQKRRMTLFKRIKKLLGLG